jgi:hypothetical protein
MKAFRELGDAIGKAWRKSRRKSFAEIATEALLDSDVLRAVGIDDIVRWFASASEAPAQNYRDFGQPPINLYVADDFVIEVLFWLDSTTAVHQHAFSGAFGVLAGSSVHSRYRFEKGESLGSHIRLGEVEFMSSELLRSGDVRTILPGDRFIHSLFHLERPSLSVVVRTSAEVDGGPQYSYLRPHLAIDPFHKVEPAMTRLRMLESLKRTGHDLFWPTARTLIERCDLWMLFKVLWLAYHRFHGSEDWSDLLGQAREKHGERLDLLLPCLEEQERQLKIIARREVITDPEHRFFLALLLNVPNRRAIYDLISRRLPEDDPEATVIRWVKELSSKKLLDVDADDLSLDLLQLALRDDSQNAIGALAADGQKSEAQEVRRRVRSSHLLAPLFRA